MNDKTLILQVKNISKTFPGVKALTNVSIKFELGEVHALVGENGAGKSTLIKIISGIHNPTEGKIFYENHEIKFRNPRQALECGISVIHQELSIANELTVAENIYLGVEPRMGGKKGVLLDRKKMNQEAQKVLDQMQVHIEATTVAGTLSAAHQQMIEIAKVISKKSRFVIMDEPTSSLSENEIEALFEQIRLLKKNKVTIVYITHRMKELQQVCDSVTVLRDGNVVKSMRISETSEREIVSNMVGREIDDYYGEQEHEKQEEMLRVEGLTVEGVFRDISFSVCKGEIFGIAGLVGAKRTDVLESIFGAIKLDSGEVFIEGKKVEIKSPKEAIELKMGFVTEDRRSTGLMLEGKIVDNIVLPSIKKNSKKAGILNLKWEKEVTKEYFKKLRIKAPNISTIISTLSGGNQQKVILAKWLVAESKILLLDEPTRGIDVNAKSEFYKLMDEYVKEGGSIVMVSSELPEILGVSDRIMVMREGEKSGELCREEASEEKIIRFASICSED